jgi:small subunit ribosomal protein S9
VNSGIDRFGRAYGTGKRKTAVARVWIKDGSGQFLVNDKRFIDYFQPLQREAALGSFVASSTSGFFDVWCTVKGGGMSGMTRLLCKKAWIESWIVC